MTLPLNFSVTGVPKPKGSPRPLKLGNGRTIISIHQTDDALSWEQACIRAAAAAWGEAPHDGPVIVRHVIYMPRPASVKRELPSTKPDGDKLTRLILDALQAAGVLSDDSRVVAWPGCKVYCEPGEVPGVDVRVESCRCRRQALAAIGWEGL